MKRRNFLRNSLATAFTTATIGNILASPSERGGRNLFAAPAEKPFTLLFAPHDKMFSSHAGSDFVEQIKFMHDQGFRSIEDNGMLKRSKEEQNNIGATLSIEYQTSNVIDALRRGAAIFEPHGLIMVLEPLSDTPELFMRYSDQTYELCKAVDSPSCKILFDIYHMQRNEGNLLNNIDRCWDEIAYFQIGDNPGRKEPTTGEVNYKNIFKHVHSKGYRGVWGMEHGNLKPGKEGELALIKAYRECDYA